MKELLAQYYLIIVFNSRSVTCKYEIASHVFIVYKVRLWRKPYELAPYFDYQTAEAVIVCAAWLITLNTLFIVLTIMALLFVFRVLYHLKLILEQLLFLFDQGHKHLAGNLD